MEGWHPLLPGAVPNPCAKINQVSHVGRHRSAKKGFDIAAKKTVAIVADEERARERWWTGVIICLEGRP